MINYSIPYAAAASSNDTDTGLNSSVTLADLQRMVTELGPGRSLTRALDTFYIHHLDYPVSGLATSAPSLSHLLWIVGYVSLICCIATSVAGLLFLTRNTER